MIRFFGESSLRTKGTGMPCPRSRRWVLSSPGTDRSSLYFQGGTNGEDGLVAEMRTWGPIRPSRLNLARLVLDELIKGPVAWGFCSGTLPRGTREKSSGLSIHQGVCHVDFGQGLAGNHWGGGRREDLTIYSVVNTFV